MCMKVFDVVAIGDTVVDEFIRIENAAVHCTLDTEKCELCFGFGDKIPFTSHTTCFAVGNSANAAVAAARLGLSTALITNLGDDELGKHSLRNLRGEGVETSLITSHRDKPTNDHFVLWYENERTILIKHENYAYKLPKFGVPKWIYLSSLAQDSEAFHDEVASYLEIHPSIRLAFQPGTFQLKMGSTKLSRIYARTEAFFSNIEEAMRVLGTENRDVPTLVHGIHALGPRMVILTDGPKGLYASDGTHMYFLPIYPDPKPPLERTGAGDATSSTITAMLSTNMPLKDALRYGPINSMSVVQFIGAQAGLLSRKNIEKYLNEAPAEYLVQKYP